MPDARHPHPGKDEWKKLVAMGVVDKYHKPITRPNPSSDCFY